HIQCERGPRIPTPRLLIAQIIRATPATLSANLLTAQNVAGVMELLQFAKSRRGGELIGIIILALGICLSLALLTYHPDDSSAFYTSTNTAVANWIGYYGATVAWLLVSFLGFAGILFPAPLLILGWNRFRVT